MNAANQVSNRFSNIRPPNDQATTSFCTTMNHNSTENFSSVLQNESKIKPIFRNMKENSTCNRFEMNSNEFPKQCSCVHNSKRDSTNFYTNISFDFDSNSYSCQHCKKRNRTSFNDSNESLDMLRENKSTEELLNQSLTVQVDNTCETSSLNDSSEDPYEQVDLPYKF